MREYREPGAALDLLDMHRSGLTGDDYMFSVVFTAVSRDRTGRFDGRALALFGDVPLARLAVAISKFRHNPDNREKARRSVLSE